MVLLSEVTGLWRRSLIAWPDGRRDTSSKVQWLQGLETFGDLRQPAQLPDFAHVRSLSDLSRSDCEQLAEQQAFAGHLTVVGDYFEWSRSIDFQPAGALPDAGSLRWQEDILVEEGRDVPYREHWHRAAGSENSRPIAGALLRHAVHGAAGVIVRVGDLLMFARDQKIALPPGGTLRECLDTAMSIEHARAMLDCEISFATAKAGCFTIDASTLPFRVGQRLRGIQNAEWNVKKSKGDVATLTLL
jgi:hypothetical protein